MSFVEKGMIMGKHGTKGKTGMGIWLAVLLLAAFLAAGGFFLTCSRPVELIGELTVEAGDPLPPAQAFLPEGVDAEIFYASDVSQLPTGVPGTYPVALSVKGKPREVCIRIVDTVAPQGTVQDLTALQIDMPSAADFVTEVRDVTAVTVSFEREPDDQRDDPQEVGILLTDTSGNVTRLQACLTVIIDNEAPVIAGVQDFLLYQGGTVSYRSGVTVTDCVDPNPLMVVDSSRVDLSAPGQYAVYYIANDISGNVAVASATVTVLEKKESYAELETIYAAADELLTSIIGDGMTDREKAEAVYWWIRNHCQYVGTSDKDDWRQAAYQMLQTHIGDCFNYFALSKLLLERLGIPTIDVVKVPNYEGDSMHYWCLVSVDGGETYYHFDTTPRIGGGSFCLVTDAYLDAFSAGYRNCFNRDKSLYPPTPGE